MDVEWALQYSNYSFVTEPMSALEGGKIIAALVIAMLALKGLCDIL